MNAENGTEADCGVHPSVCVCGLYGRCAVVIYASEDSANAAVTASADRSDVLQLHNRSAHKPLSISLSLSVCLSLSVFPCLHGIHII